MTRTSVSLRIFGFIRVRSPSGVMVYNAAKGKRERLGGLLQMHANKREDIKR